MTRRGPSEGSIYKRSDGRWVAVLHLGYEDGHRKRKYLYGDSRREVQEKLSVSLRAQRDGLPPTNDRLTVAQFLARWLDTIRPSVRPSTHTSYSLMVRLHIVPELGRVHLAKLSAQQLQAHLNAKLASGLSPRTVGYIHAVIRQALNRGVRWGDVPRNVATLVDPPRYQRAEVRSMTPEQARTFLDSVRGKRLEALYTVALALGLRQGEALALRWTDIDMEAGNVTVRAGLQRQGGKLVLVEPKTPRSRRTIAAPPIVVAALRSHRSRQLQDRLAAGSEWQDLDFVFCTQAGGPLDSRNVTRDFQRALTKAGLPHMRFHDLRHSCASLLLAQGVHPRVVMETLGHSQIALTMNTYSHVIPALQREAADRMQAALSV